MSYTTGGQTIDKSMNGIITFDTGGGVVISGDTITAPNIIATSTLRTSDNGLNIGVDNLMSIGSRNASNQLNFNNDAAEIPYPNAGYNFLLNNIPRLSMTYQGTIISLLARFTGTLSVDNGMYVGTDGRVLLGLRGFNDRISFINNGIFGDQSFEFLINSVSRLLIQPALITSSVEINATKFTSSGDITASGIIIAPTLNCTTQIFYDVNQEVKSQVITGRLIFTNSATPSGGRSYEFKNGTTSLLLMENALITLGVPATTASNLSLTGTAALSLATGTSLSLASGSSMSSAGNISLTSAANFTTSSTGIFFNSAQDISIKAVLSQLQFNIANTATAPRSYQFKLAALTPLLIEATTTTITNSSTATASVNALEIKNSEATPSNINFLLNAVAATANPNVAAGDDVIYSNGGILNLTTTSATNVGVRISTTDVAITANTTSLTGTTTNLTSGTTNINGATLTTISTPTTTITGTTTNLNSSSATIVKNGQTASSSAIAFSITNSVVSPNPNIISFGCNLGAGNYNAIVQAGDAAIIAGGNVGTQNLCITSHSSTAVGIRITGAGAVDITGSTTISSALALANGSTATTQAATESSTNVATTAYVNRADFLTNPLELYFNVGVGGGSGAINLKRMNYDPILASTPVSFNLQMNFNAMRLDQDVTYTGVTTHYPASPAGGLIQIGMYNIGGSLLASTGVYTSVGTAGFHSLNFSTAYTPTTNIMVWIGTHILVSTTTTQMATSAGTASAGNPSPAPTTALCAGRGFYITKPATFPSTINGIAKTAQNFFYWYGMY